MAFASTARVQALTQDYFMPRVVDTILNSNVLAAKLLANAKKFRGEAMKFPVKVSKNATGGSASGYDTLDTNSTDNIVKLSYAPKWHYKAVSLPLDEITANNGSEEKVLDLIDIHTAGAAHDMADDLGTVFYSDGTGNSSKNFLGLSAIVDDGGTVATIGGLSRSTYTTLQSTVTASGGTVSLAKLSTLHSAAAHGSIKPTLGLTTETVWNLIETLIAPQERIMKDVPLMKGGVTGSGGLTGIIYRGVPIVADEKCTSGVFFWLNEANLQFYGDKMAMAKPINFKGGDIVGNDYESLKGLGFSYTDWKQPVNQNAIVSHIFCYGELVTDDPGNHAKLTGITST